MSDWLTVLLDFISFDFIDFVVDDPEASLREFRISLETLIVEFDRYFEIVLPNTIWNKL